MSPHALTSTLVSAFFVAMILVPHGAATAANLASCPNDGAVSLTPSRDVVAAHRQFDLPVIHYAYGSLREDLETGLLIEMTVDPSGKVLCASASEFGRPLPLNDERRAVLAQVSMWHYKPFDKDGHAVTAQVRERIAEEEAPERRAETPEVPLEAVHFGLKRSQCFGTCPAYSVDIDGRGHVTFVGEGFLDVAGRHEYNIDPHAVAQLFASMRAKQLWSLRGSYQARITDNPTFVVTMQLGAQTHTIVDYVGQAVGMPTAVTQFEDEIDEAAGTRDFISLTSAGLSRLKASGFDFSSTAAGEMLYSATLSGRAGNDAMLVELVQLGAPLDAKPKIDFRANGSLMEQALRQHRSRLVEALLARNVLCDEGMPSQVKLDAAFRAAVEGGRIADVKRIWDAAPPLHPALVFVEDSHSGTSAISIVLALEHWHDAADVWQGREITQWLAAHGASLAGQRSDGTTLLQIAVASDDMEFVRLLLTRGVQPGEAGGNRSTPIGYAHSEDMTMLLLDAGAAPTTGEPSDSLAARAQRAHWQRVQAWLDAHEAAVQATN